VVVEPELWRQPDASARQWQFCRESLEELRAELATLGQPLVVRVGQVTAVLERIQRHWPIAGLWSHQETGNGWTYNRDRQVAAWTRQHGIAWTELASFGVVRRLASRDGWARRWEALMAEPRQTSPRPLRPLRGVAAGRPTQRPRATGELPPAAKPHVPARPLQPAHRLRQLFAVVGAPGLGNPVAAGGGAAQPPSAGGAARQVHSR